MRQLVTKNGNSSGYARGKAHGERGADCQAVGKVVQTVSHHGHPRVRLDVLDLVLVVSMVLAVRLRVLERVRVRVVFSLGTVAVAVRVGMLAAVAACAQLFVVVLVAVATCGTLDAAV